ncbi:MAG: oxygen-independent coproporphyrinogen III oxidase [Pseudomonadales bacterium]
MDQVDLSIISKYDVSGPRYTSYPTALQFAELDDDQYIQAIHDSPRKDKDISLYFHIPFCDTLCYYCACNKIITRDKSKAEDYLRLLYREIELKAEHLAGRSVSQLHWGGGTPTFLSDLQIQALMDKNREHFQLWSDEDGEFSIEIDPRTVDEARIQALRKAGFNRLSMGIQDFNPVVQKAVNRIQSFEATESVIKAARGCGFRSISVDLIYGLPHQTVESVRNTLDQIIELSPDRISIYNYAHLPDRFTPQKRIKLVDLPSADNKLRILKLCIEKLTGEAGYCYIGMDHFAKPEDELAVAQSQGTLHRNFQGYSTFSDRDLIAFGVTAISLVGNTYAQNTKQMDEYERRINSGQLPVEKGVVIDQDDLIRKAVIMALICHFEIEFADIEAEFGINFTNYFAEELEQLEQFAGDGLLILKEDSIQVTDKGRLLIRNICMCFDRHLKQVSGQRFSKAI